MHQALYRKWRPQTFDDVYGQEHITSILKYEIQNTKFSHAYLFCGSRGTGKTTCAKILSKAVNCEASINGNPCNCCASCRSIDAGIATDVLEMDAASNNGVEHIRDIRDEVIYTPSVLKYRVYIVDEVHMLSASAFNALLKTLEEPPAHVVFILATTELHKLPATIISRCQRYDFRRITTDVIMERLSLIADSEKIEYTPDALRIIAKMAQGGMRDAISLLELCAGTRQNLTAQLVNDTLGAGGRENLEKMAKAILKSDFEAVFETFSEIVTSSKDVSVFWQDLVAFYRDMLVVKTTSFAKKYLDLTDDEYLKLNDLASMFTKEMLLYHCRVLDDSYAMMLRSSVAKRTVAEMALVKMCDPMLDDKTDALASRISKLENIIETGNFVSSAYKDEPSKEVNVASMEPTDNSDHLAEEKNVEKIETEVTLKVLRGWNEVAQKVALSNSDPSLIGFLKMGKALIDTNGHIYIRFPNDFALDLAVSNRKVKDSICATLSSLLKRALTEKEITFGVFEGNENSAEELDELNI